MGSINTRRPFALFSLESEDPAFKLSEAFLDEYRHKEPNWGPIGYVVYKRTYARTLPDGTTEEWWQTVQRVVEGTYRIQQLHCAYNHVKWDQEKAQRSAQEMYERIFSFKFLPPGRGLWMMGTDFIKTRGGAALNNCAFTSTENIGEGWSEFVAPFAFLMDMSMLGVGVGGDCRGAGRAHIVDPMSGTPVQVCIEDTREAWVHALQCLLRAYVDEDYQRPTFDYSKIRPAGEPIRGFGGVASGAAPLRKLLEENIPSVLDRCVGAPIDSTAIVDIFNVIGVCVVAGNVRRTAEIMFSHAEDAEFMALKDPTASEAHQKAMISHRWASNNSIFPNIGMDYRPVAERIVAAGEPGLAWLDNMQRYSRMIDPPDEKDWRAMGGNPCQPGWATVLTPEGIRTFDDIREGSVIWSGSQWTTVTKKWSTGVKPIYRYRTSAGEFIGTENHRIVQNGTKVEVKDAEFIDVSVGPFIAETDLAPVDPQDVMNGLMLGDGTNNGGSGRGGTVLLIGENDQDYFDSEIANLLGPQVSDTAWRVESMFSQLPPLPERSVPTRYFTGSEREMRGFLRGLYTANGSVIKSKRAGRVTLKTTSSALRDDVQHMLSALGIQSYYTTNTAHDVEFANGVYSCRESYDINISSDRHLFAALIGFLQRDKSDKLREICESTTTRHTSMFRIREIEFLGEEEVFDITVEAAEHTYWTGGVLVSNCLEQTLESFELCCLVETFPAHHATLEDYLETCKYAYLYAKTVTLLPTHDPRTNAVMARNRRIGMSQSGIVQSFGRHGRRTHFEWCDKAYRFTRKLDEKYSNWLAVPRSIKMTSVKPSGCRPSDALTSTNQGLLTLGELVEAHPEEMAWSEVSGLSAAGVGTVSKTYRNGISPTVKLRMRYGMEVESTPNHQWEVTRGGETLWVRADEIRPGDRLTVEMGHFEEREGVSLRYVEPPQSNMGPKLIPLALPESMTPDLAWLLGYTWGNGALSPSKRRFRYMDQHVDSLEKVQSVLASFGLPSTIHRASEGRDAWTVEVGSVHLWAWFEANGFMKYDEDGLALIPRAVRASGRAEVCAFLAGWMDADGCLAQRGGAWRLIGSTLDERFGRHVQDVAWAVGLGFGRSLNAQNEGRLGGPVWLMTLSAHVDPAAFGAFVEASVIARRKPSDEPWSHEVANRKYRPGVVLSVEAGEPVETFDIEVPEHHWFWAGAVKSHNTVSKLAGASPGIHYPISQYYIRRVTFAKNHPLVDVLAAHGYPVEDSVYSSDSVVVSFPVKEPYFVKGESDVTLWEQLENAAQMQAYWADNQVSCTVKFHGGPDAVDEISSALSLYETRLKGVSFLPHAHGYAQAPEETISQEQYEELAAKVKPLTSAVVNFLTHDTEDKFCDGGACEIPAPK